jgi:hypothetical protein
MIVQPDNHQLRAGLANRRATEVSNYRWTSHDPHLTWRALPVEYGN